MSFEEQKNFIASIPPFDRLSDDERGLFARSMDIAYYHEGDRLIWAGIRPQYLFLIIKGVVHERDEKGLHSVYSNEDIFDAVTLLEGPSDHDFVAAEEVICYLLPRALFVDFARNNHLFQSYFYEDLSQKLEALAQQQRAESQSEFLTATIDEAHVHPPVFVDADCTIRDAGLLMVEKSVNTLFVRAGDRTGIITGLSMARAVINDNVSRQTPVAQLARYDLVSLEIGEFLFNALLLMTRHRLSRVVVKRRGNIVGVLEQVDLLSYFSNQSHLVNMEVDRAESLAELREASANTLTVVRALNDQGVKMRHLTQLVSELNHKVLHKLFDMLAPADLIANSCLLVMGSEGREEQVLKTDQDNALILRDEFSPSELQTFTTGLSEALTELGYPPCPGEIMVSNPAWVRSQQDFKSHLFHWVMQRDRQSVLNLAIFYDALAVGGDPALLEGILRYLFQVLSDHQAFFAHFALAAVQFDTPLGLFRRLVVEKTGDEEQLDIKKGGIFPIVHGVRSLALEHRLPVNNTVARIHALTEFRVYEPDFASELADAFEFMSQVRLNAMLNRLDHNERMDNYVRPADLNKRERDLLEDAFKIVKAFKRVLVNRYKLNWVR